MTTAPEFTATEGSHVVWKYPITDALDETIEFANVRALGTMRSRDAFSARAAPSNAPTSSPWSMWAFTPNVRLKDPLCTRASPAITTRIAVSGSGPRKLRVFAMRAGSTPRAAAAASTVAVPTDSGVTMTSSTWPRSAR